MDIIQQLPFPDEICSKILLYAFKSPHIHLPEEIFKRAVPTDIYQKLVEKGGIEKNEKGHVTKVLVNKSARWLLDDAERESLQFDIQVFQGFRHLTTFFLDGTGVFGDIQVLQGLRDLTEFSLTDTGVFGDIKVLQGLQNLTEFYLEITRVTGDEEAFHEYRKSHGLKKCDVYMDNLTSQASRMY